MEEKKEIKKGWNWLAFFFAPYYYAGYGRLKRGLVYAVVGGLIPLFALAFAIESGRKANKDLPIDEQEFNWKNAGITIAVSILIGVLLNYFIYSLSNSTPNCSSKQTKNLVIQIAKQELTKQGAENLIPDLSFEVQDIMTTNRDEKLDTYMCSANFKMSGIRNKILPITYDISSTDDGSKFFVNVYGF